MMKAYLAGPEVFLPDPSALAARKKAICRRYGFEGLDPCENDLTPEPSPSPASLFAGNLRMVEACDVVVANLTPFRGPSGDIGVAFEVGVAFAMGKPVFGYSNDPRVLRDRVLQNPSEAVGSGRPFHTDGLAVEDFGLPENLMLSEAVRSSGGIFVRGEPGPALPLTDLRVFESCVAEAARILVNRRGPTGILAENRQAARSHG
ncbi:nucleoside 2-deoxyribosyltransferase [Hansschlegelia sp.]|uniref:nucleoside 2-deoxyribosyltransferase n=1 Tax=Hansschlegelia sp. TaxID=2041892 RepID=UPI002C5AD1A7|nr:nucleoside 2-deoxyribosyltransferase [Hansschlegelia sp.]HVI29077.1 nucleoside 2-deoxyribosyltransferase [Hansschlegelia sp.]